MKFSQLAVFFERIEKTSLRNSITNYLAELFNDLSPLEIDKTVYLLQGRVGPLFEKINFGMAEKMVIKAITQALSLERKLFVDNYGKIGDLGLATEHFKKQIRSFDEQDRSVESVYADLYRLAVTGGDGSQETKIGILGHLIRQLDPLSARYLVRIPLGILRLGFSDMTVLDAYSWMLTGDKSLRPAIEKAYHVRPDLGFIGKTLKEKGIKGLSNIEPKIFTPILMMRAERLSSAAAIVEKIGTSIIEPKYDGFRVQIHYSRKKNEVRIYSRNLEDVSFMYPDIVEGIKKEVRANEIITEGEAIGYDPATGNFLPFQETVQRKRKYGIADMAKTVPLKLFLFELLYLDGKSYLFEKLETRKAILEKHLIRSGKTEENVILPAEESQTKDPHKVEALFEDAISRGLEGIIAKKPDGIYQAGARGWNWIKFKRSYSSKINDTIDCLVMGYDFGRGKRADFGIGAFLVGVYDEKNDCYKTVAKIGTGLTDIEWKELKKRADKGRSKSRPAIYEIDEKMTVDLWIKPSIIVEIKADEITRSSVHTAGRVMKVSKSGSAFEVETPGFALRFPRLVRFRDDKRPEDATTVAELKNLVR